MTGISEDLAGVVARWPELAEGNPELLLRGPWVNCDFMIEVGDTPYYATLARGRFAAFDRGPLLMRPWTFAIRGAETAWREFWRPVPRPMFHDIFALAKQKAFVIEGDIRPLMTNLLFFKELLAAPRGHVKETA